MARLSARQRKVRSRRLKQLAEERDELLGELGEMALEMTRRGAIHRDYLAKGAAEVADIEREISELKRSLGLEGTAPEEPFEPTDRASVSEATEEPVGLAERLKGFVSRLSDREGAEVPPEQVPPEPPAPPAPPEQPPAAAPPEQPPPAPPAEQAPPAPPEQVAPAPRPPPPPEESAGAPPASAEGPGAGEKHEARSQEERPLDGVRRVLALPTIATAAVLAIGAVLILLAYSDLRSDAEREALAGSFAVPPAEQEPEEPVSEIASWPADQEGWTVSLGSAVVEEGARALARQAIDRGLEAGVLDTNDFPGLEPGMFLVFSGHYEIRAEAEEAAVEAQNTGYEDAFPLSVQP